MPDTVKSNARSLLGTIRSFHVRHPLTTPRPRLRRTSCALVLLIGLIGCGADDGTGPEQAVATSVTVTPTSLELLVGETRQLSATVLAQDSRPMAASVAWSTDTPSVASVSGSGLATGLSDGNAGLTASVSGTTVASTVTVTVTSPLNTEPRTESGGDWGNGVSASGVEWRLQSVGESGTTGSYNLTFANGNPVPVNISYELRFYDAGGFQLANHPSTGSLFRSVAPNGEAPTTGTFLLPSITDVVVANGIARMEIWAAFAPIYPDLVVTTTSLPNALTGSSYEVSLGATGGDGAYTWSMFMGQLPSGLALSPDGRISGIPLEVGSRSFTVQVSSGDGQAAGWVFTINVRAPLQIATASLPSGTVGSSYSQFLDETGGSFPYTWSVSSGALPAGLSLDSGLGRISGTPASAGMSTFSLQVTSGDGQTAEREFTLAIYGPLAVTASALPIGVTGQPFSETLTATGGDGNYLWSVSTGLLPNGLTLSPGGTMSGTPTSTDYAIFWVTVTSGDGQSDTRQFSLRVYDPLVITTPSLPSGTVGQPYFVLLEESGGGVLPTWSVSDGTLPDGLTLSGLGALSGTPNTAGSSTFTVQVQTDNGQAASREFNLVVDP